MVLRACGAFSTLREASRDRRRLARLTPSVRRLALKHHPDRGGTDAEFNAITRAYDAALLEVEATRVR